MKKSFLIILLINIIFTLNVEAKNIRVETLSDFSTANPPEVIELKIKNGFTTKKGNFIPENSIIIGNVINVKEPKRLKRDATFSVAITDYMDASSGQAVKIDKKIIGKYSKLTDVTPKSVIKTGAIAAGNKIVGAYLGPSVALVKGAIKNEQGNIVKSAAASVYDSSPLSYAKKGQNLEFNAGDIFVMNFKVKEDVDNEESVTEDTDGEAINIESVID